ncbi:F-box only protein 36 [Clonorchis sinensis]|uniref:F-box only protein 36 n=1 Tax=Clonorchis sinensis TaxID=79923 RepID=A0A8T1MPX9_CLOSI|nr:F-box only protein 36 [Clonorchis sinensis]
MVQLSAVTLENPLFKRYKLFPGGVLAELACTAPSPQRDFHHLLITTKSFTWRSWKITSRNDGAKYHPAESTATHEEFLHDERMQSDILRVLGPKVLEYCQNIAHGFIDYLVRLPSDVMAKIISHLQLEDVINLGYTCKAMHALCNDNNLWKDIFCRNSPSAVNETVEELATLFGWKRLFFTNKVQLQMQVRRLRMEHASISGDEIEENASQFEEDIPKSHGSDIYVETPSSRSLY